MNLTILKGDAFEQLRTLPDESVHCCVTSPPYWGLRDYGVPEQLGLERTPEEYVSRMVEIFREVHRVLRPDGTCWVNLGDCYATGAGALGDCPGGGKQGRAFRDKYWGKNGAIGLPAMTQPNRMPIPGLKPKDLVGIPWRVAFALQSAGWWLRCDIIWHKPNPMPESVTDRPTKSHEYLFLLTKSERYFYDAEAIKEKSSPDTHARISQASLNTQNGGSKSDAYAMNFPGKKSRDRRPSDILKSMSKKFGVNPKAELNAKGSKQNESFSAAISSEVVITRNKRSVWTVCTAPYAGAHFATFPPDLIKPCILAGCPRNGTVLDPFGGSGTTGAVAIELGRRAILIELNPDYVKLIEDRCNITPGLPL